MLHEHSHSDQKLVHHEISPPPELSGKLVNLTLDSKKIQPETHTDNQIPKKQAKITTQAQRKQPQQLLNNTMTVKIPHSKVSRRARNNDE